MGIWIIGTIVGGIVALFWWLSSLPTLDDKFRNIQSSIVGMTYEEVIEHLGREHSRTESSDRFSIFYLKSRIVIHFSLNEAGNWVCEDYSYNP